MDHLETPASVLDDPRAHAFEHRIRFDECDAEGRLRSGGYLRLIQDVAWRHSELLGFGRDWYRTNRLAWLVRHADLSILGEARSGDTMGVTTRVTGWRRVWARRESEAIVEGDVVARATIDWVLIDAAGRPSRVPPGIAERFTEGIPTFQPTRLEVPGPPADARRHDWLVSIRDLDPMAHVNNATYLDVLDEALASVSGDLTGHRPPVRYEVGFLRPALPRSHVTIAHWRDGDRTCAVCIDHEGTNLVCARIGAP